MCFVNAFRLVCWPGRAWPRLATDWDFCGFDLYFAVVCLLWHVLPIKTSFSLSSVCINLMNSIASMGFSSSLSFVCMSVVNLYHSPVKRVFLMHMYKVKCEFDDIFEIRVLLFIATLSFIDRNHTTNWIDNNDNDDAYPDLKWLNH